MTTPTMLDTVRSLLGVPACAIPLSVCKLAKTYLLERAEIPTTGTAILSTVNVLWLFAVRAKVISTAVSVLIFPVSFYGIIPAMKSTEIHQKAQG